MALTFPAPFTRTLSAVVRPRSGLRTSGWSSDRRTSRRRRRDLRDQDRRSARLAELTLIGDLLLDAQAVITRGWLQHDWFGAEPEGSTDRPACLVGAVILAAGGPETRFAGLVQRSLDVIWHAYAEDASTSLQLGPPSNVRMARVRALTAWNDEFDRHPHEVHALLGAARSSVERERASLLHTGVGAPVRAPRR